MSLKRASSLYSHTAKDVTGRDRTFHGLRAFYATVRRSQGAVDAQIGAEMGHAAGALVERVYAGLPPQWRGFEAMSFRCSPRVFAWWNAWETIALPLSDQRLRASKSSNRGQRLVEVIPRFPRVHLPKAGKIRDELRSVELANPGSVGVELCGGNPAPDAGLGD